MSMANAMRVRLAARKDRREAIKVKVTWVEKENRSATKAAMVATGWTASPRVQLLPMVMTWPLPSPTETEYA